METPRPIHMTFLPLTLSPFYSNPPLFIHKTTLPPSLIAYHTMQRAAAKHQPRRSSGGDAAEEEKVFKGDQEFADSSSNYLKTIFALALWLGTIHLNAALVLFALLFLCVREALLLLGLLFVLMLIPIDEKSKFGRKLSRCLFLFAA
ncbi:unnamed protein product [Sphenostylis stenocarpa]|uniref:Uncharacterized protein n=1 Tax=Sphenostylis stenocarpa TaxID=92480 RepID=A0AA86S7R6_9FABA|nr:unnamed protein product [Sphenostylis stenocarpa]